MKNLIYFLAAAFMISIAVRCAPADPRSISETLPADKFQELLSGEKGVLIDVRSQEEYEESHIDGARNFNVETDGFRTQVDTLNRDVAYFLYCRSGKRSAKAIGIMQELGFKRLYNLGGGITEWKKNNLPIIKRNTSQPI